MFGKGILLSVISLIDVLQIGEYWAPERCFSHVLVDSGVDRLFQVCLHQS
jgi:hypothetical protein